MSLFLQMKLIFCKLSTTLTLPLMPTMMLFYSCIHKEDKKKFLFFTKEEQIEIDDKNMCLVSCRYDDAKMYALSDTNCIKFSSFSVWERSSLLLFLFLFKHIQFLIAWKKYFVRWKMKDANNNIRMKEDEKLSWNT